MTPIHSIDSLRANLRPYWQMGRSIGFVPTMGALHAGHLSLVERAVPENQLTVASVFVNPAQFGPGEDLESYPRRLAEDARALYAAGVDVVFAPDANTIYPPDAELILRMPKLGAVGDGVSRPQFFHGITLVVAKLFNLVRPTRAYFGEKDFQQLFIIRKMARELFLEVEVIGCPIVREADGLAMSSRNEYLSAIEREQATILYKTLTFLQRMVAKGKINNTAAARELVRDRFSTIPNLHLDYFEVRDKHTFAPVEQLAPSRELRMLIAANLGRTRLIDNMDVFPA